MKEWLSNVLIGIGVAGIIILFFKFVNWAIEPIREVVRYNSKNEKNKRSNKKEI